MHNVKYENNKHEFCQQVGLRVEEQYGLSDGEDLCFSLMDTGAVKFAMSVDDAARIVAMHMAQA